ncbi:MAG: protein kinase, partial [Verrucomicrobiota bacterium]
MGASDADRRHRTGLVTVLFTDMVGSTALKQQLGDHASSAFFDQHHLIVRQTLGLFSSGTEIGTAGDSFLITFDTPSDAVKFALLLQSRLAALSLEQKAGALDRIGIHVGEVVIKEDQPTAKPRDLYGIPIDTCSRIMSLAAGGQTLMSRFAFDTARPMLRGAESGDVQWLNHGFYQLKGIDEPLEVCEVRFTGSATSPPTTNDKARRLAKEGDVVLGWRPALQQLVPGTRWKLIEKLGEGGFGEVWLGHHEVLKEKRVFKFCFQAEMVRSLKRELTLFRILKEKVGEHPNIAAIREVNFDTAPFYIEMDYVAGQDLKAWCEAQGGATQVPEAAKLEVVAQMADALQAAHECGIVHRDVKPGNILVADDVRRLTSSSAADAGASSRRLLPEGINAKLTDFGIGQVLSEEYLSGMTRAGFTQTMLSGSSSSAAGTHLYMAPELLAGKPASARSDIYSLGVVLYQLLIGDFSQAVTIDWARRITDPLLREDLEKCFAGDPQERFGSAAELARNLRTLPERRAELDRRQAELVQRERAAYRRGMTRAAGLAAVVVALVACLAVVAYRRSRQAKAAQKAADEQAQKATESQQHSRRLLYAADMNLAQQTLKLNNLGRARRLLVRHRPQPGEEDLRGWEWRYLWQLTRSSALVTLTNR